MDLRKIQNLIDSADIVSFDVFDTLITRKVLHPTDVFSLVSLFAEQRMIISFDFRELRLEAEKSLAESEFKNSYSILDIYKEIAQRGNLTEEDASQLLGIELEAEEKLVVPRKDVQELFLNLYNSGKKLILDSDM